MHDDFRLNWTLPAVSPGPAIKQEKPEQVCEFREFETKDCSLGTVPHGRMLSARGGAGVGQTDDGALASGPGMRARNAEGSPASSPPKGKWVPSKYGSQEIDMFWVGDRCAYNEGQAMCGAFSQLEWVRLP